MWHDNWIYICVRKRWIWSKASDTFTLWARIIFFKSRSFLGTRRFRRVPSGIFIIQWKNSCRVARVLLFRAAAGTHGVNLLPVHSGCSDAGSKASRSEPQLTFSVRLTRAFRQERRGESFVSGRIEGEEKTSNFRGKAADRVPDGEEFSSGKRSRSRAHRGKREGTWVSPCWRQRPYLFVERSAGRGGPQKQTGEHGRVRAEFKLRVGTQRGSSMVVCGFFFCFYV